MLRFILMCTLWRRTWQMNLRRNRGEWSEISEKYRISRYQRWLYLFGRFFHWKKKKKKNVRVSSLTKAVFLRHSGFAKWCIINRGGALLRNDTTADALGFRIYEGNNTRNTYLYTLFRLAAIYFANDPNEQRAFSRNFNWLKSLHGELSCWLSVRSRTKPAEHTCLENVRIIECAC